MPRPPVPEALWFWHSDKLMHAAAYAVLAALASIGAGRPRWRLALALTIAYGAFDEVHQAYVPGRQASAADFAADATGAALFTAGALALGRRRQPS